MSESHSIPFEFQYAIEDVQEANKYAQKQATRSFRPTRSFIVWVVLIALAIGLNVLLNTEPSPAPPPPAAPPRPDFLWNILLPFMPWLLIFAGVWFILFHALRRGVRGVWEKTPAFHRPHHGHVKEDCLLMVDPYVRTELKWEAFTAFIETPSLFMLGRGPVYDFIPKRAFRPEDLEAVRRLLSTRIKPPSGGFPVITPQSLPPPRPIEPLEQREHF